MEPSRSYATWPAWPRSSSWSRSTPSSSRPSSRWWARAGPGWTRWPRPAIAKRPWRSASVQSLDRYISATQLGITLASLGLGWIGEPALAGLIHGVPSPGFPIEPEIVATHAVAATIAFIIITILHIILGELVPKALALLYPEDGEPVGRGSADGLRLGHGVPDLRSSTAPPTGCSSLMHICAAGEHERLHSPEEIRMLVEQSQEGGSLGKEDARLLEGVFEFTEKTAQEVMTPRTQMVALEPT